MNLKLTFTLTLLLSINLVFGANITFTGAGDGTSWNDPANWNTGTVPGINDDANIGGTFFVLLTGTPGNVQSLNIFDDAQLNIDFGNSLLVSNGGILLEDNAFIANLGNLTVFDAPNSGIFIEENSGMFSLGIIQIIFPDGNGISMRDFSEFTNQGLLSITDGDADGLNMDDESYFINIGGSGIIQMTDIEDEGINMDDDTEFINDGSIQIDGIDGNDGICIDDSGSYFQNAGNISIQNVIDEGEGIELDDGEFLNLPSGIISLNAVTGDVLRVESGGEFTNLGSLFINATGTTDDDNAVEIESDATLSNENLINISVESSANPDAIELESNSSVLNNTECGVINILSSFQIENNGTIDNDGRIATVFGGVNTNDGTFNNNGLIIAPNGFNVAPNALAVAGTIDFTGLVPTTSACGLAEGNIGGCNGNTLNTSPGSYTQTAAGCFYASPWTSDQLSAATAYLCGNAEIIAEVSAIYGQAWAGLSMRENLNPGSKKVQLMTNGSYFVRRETRSMTNGTAFPQQYPSFGKKWLRLVRSGDFFFGYISSNGTNWQQVFSQYISMSDCIEVGIVSTNYRAIPPMTITAIFNNVDFFLNPATLVEEQVDQELNLDLNGEDRAVAFEVFPNPTNGEVNLNLKKYAETDFSVEVFNLVGQRLKRFEFAVGTTFETIDLSGLPQGVYNLSLTTLDGQRETKKIILE